MASSAHPHPHSGISSQAGLAALRAASPAPQPLAILELIDTYAAARSARDDAYSNSAEWAFHDKHDALRAARAAVADALGIPAAQLPELRDPISRRADHGIGFAELHPEGEDAR
ncbi:hypothetical protein [Microbacterium sp.]|uniref:hypothetical protein n=1 Tax=Microbacterium sp. TaxID=51671 RepID=UPI003C73948E